MLIFLVAKLCFCPAKIFSRCTSLHRAYVSLYLLINVNKDFSLKLFSAMLSIMRPVPLFLLLSFCIFLISVFHELNGGSKKSIILIYDNLFIA